MQRAFHRLRDTLIAGMFLLLPVVVLVVVLVRVYQVVHPLLVKLVGAFGIHDLFGVRIMIIVVIMVICLLAGLLVRSPRVVHWREWLEDNVLRTLPGYEYMRMRIMETLGKDNVATDRAVLVRTGDGWVPAMLVERAADGRCVIFTPDVPQCNTGSVLIVEAGDVMALNVPYARLNKSVRNYGKGLLALVPDPKEPTIPMTNDHP